jgi:hypothetical protein
MASLIGKGFVLFLFLTHGSPASDHLQTFANKLTAAPPQIKTQPPQMTSSQYCHLLNSTILP